MRYLLVTGALALLLGGTSVVASAAPSAATQTSVQTSVVSPDVAQWTGTPVQAEDVMPAKHRAVGHHHDIKRFASRILARTSTIAKSLTRSALRFLGTPYVFGGTSRSGFDCSGYVQHVFAMMGMSIPRTADAQYYAGRKIKGNMRPGDLVFFQTYEPGPSHVGIYLGKGRFVHASSSHGVMVSSLSDSYWAPKFIGAKRLIASRPLR
ncbi:MAG TPA: C40 family peptidase [Candidatus Baltobacteraceae bacterium]